MTVGKLLGRCEELSLGLGGKAHVRAGVLIVTALKEETGGSRGHMC